MPRWLPFDERFESYIQRGDGCWEWSGPRTTAGYGEINKGSKVLAAHRVSYEKFVGPIPPGMKVCHTCDNPPCVRPDHFFLGTQVDNMQDAKKKGRLRSGGAKGVSNRLAKLTEPEIVAIRVEPRRKDETRNAVNTRLAAVYGVNRRTVDCIRQGRSWRHI